MVQALRRALHTPREIFQIDAFSQWITELLVEFLCHCLHFQDEKRTESHIFGIHKNI